MHCRLIILLLMVFANHVNAASIDCKMASNDVEKIICSNNNASNADKIFSDYYSELCKKLPQDEKESIRKEQLKWLVNVRNKCDTAECIIDAYSTRKRELENPYTERQMVWKELESRAMKLEEELDKSFRRQMNETQYGPSTTGSDSKLIEARKSWEKYRNLYCEAVSSIYGGAWAGFHQRECLIKQAEAFIEMNDSYSF